MKNFNLENAGVEELIETMNSLQKKISQSSFDQIKAMLKGLLSKEPNDDFIRGFFFQPILFEIMKRLEQEQEQEKTEVYCSTCESHVETIDEHFDEVIEHDDEVKVTLSDGSGYVEVPSCSKCAN